MQPRLRQTTTNPNIFVSLFLDTMKNTTNLRMIWWMLTEATLEIWYQDDMGCPDLLSKRRWWWWWWRITCMSPMNSPSLDPWCQCKRSQPFGYSQCHTLAHAAVDHERYNCNILIPNGTADHTWLVVYNHQIDTNWWWWFKMNAYKQSHELGFILNVVCL